MCDDFNSTVVLDCGSAMCKIGFAGDQTPRAVFPTVIGTPRYGMAMNFGMQDSYVGNLALAKRVVLNFSYPIKNGHVTDWDGVEKIWEHALHTKLGISPTEHPILLMEAARTTTASREKATQIMFETLEVPALYVANQQVMALYSSGRSTGIVLDIGDVSSHAVPIYEGHVLHHAMQTLNWAGRDVTAYLMKLLMMRGYRYSSECQSDHEVVRDVMEKLCMVARDFKKDVEILKAQEEKKYTKTDGKVISIGIQRFQCPEALFDPTVMDQAPVGVHQLLHNSILKCDEVLRKELYQNIMLLGATTTISNFPERLKRELIALVPTGTKVNILSPADRQYSSWIGGSILSSQPTFKHMWIGREEYEEVGPTIVHRKCF
nr:ActL3 [Drosophila azteca]